LARRTRAAAAGAERRRFLVFLAKLVLAVVLIRSLVAAPFSIPSESMLPALMPGDYVLAVKWPYGWSRYSFPGGGLPIEGRIMGAMPARGDIVIFRAPPSDGRDFVKRVIGLPGDRIALADGQVVLNGSPLPQDRIADFVHAPSANIGCAGPAFVDRLAGEAVCRYRRFRETLPDGRAYDVIDLGPRAGDTMAPLTVPAGQVFLLGDNRDRSADSRTALGPVPVERLIGRYAATLYSSDGSAVLWQPWTWPAAARWERVGGHQ
jgi:signal peptidase I